MVAEYIAKITGDTSGLEKALKSVKGSMKQLSDDEVLIKLNYDGNVADFNKEFDKVLKQCPDLTIQFQYNVNQKMLTKELDKLQQLKNLKLDIDTNNADKKISSMITALDTAIGNDESSDKIEGRIKGIIRYANTIHELGGKIETDVMNAIYRSVESTNYEDLFNKLFDNPNISKLKLFNLSKPLNDEINETEKRIKDFQRFLETLEERGASKLGLSSELQSLQDEIKILKSDLSDMKRELDSVSGEQFKKMADDIKNVNEQLQFTLEKLFKLTGDNKLGSIVNKWGNEEITKTNERYTAFNSKTLETSGIHAAADAEGVSEKLIREAIAEMAGEADGFIHSHPLDIAAFSDTDIATFYKLLQQGITQQVVTSYKQAMSLDMSKVNPIKETEVVQLLRQRFDEAEQEIGTSFIQNNTEMVRRVANQILEGNKTGNAQIDTIIESAKSKYNQLMEQFGTNLTLDQYGEQVVDKALSDAFNESIFANQKGTEVFARVKSFMGQLSDAIIESLGDITENKNALQTRFQDILLNVFSNPEYLKAGVKSAIKVENISDFIDTNSLKQVGLLGGKFVVDGFREAIDAHSNSKEAERAVDDFANGVVDEFEKRTEDMAQAAKKAGDAVTKAFGNSLKDSSGTITPSQQFDNEVQQNLVMLENYKNTVAEIDRLKLEPETDGTKAKLEELNKLADYFASKITVIRSENGGEVNPSMMVGWGASGGWSERLKRDYSEEQRKDFLKVAKDRTGLQISSVTSEFHGISDEIANIEAKSEGLRNALAKDLVESSAYVSKLRAAYLGIAEANDELRTARPGSEDFKDYTEQLNSFLSKYPELEKFKDALGYYDKAPEFVKSDEWLDFLATLPQAHTYLESIGYDFDKINRASNENNLSSGITAPSQIDEVTDNIIEFKKKQEETINPDLRNGYERMADSISELGSEYKESEKFATEFLHAIQEIQDIHKLPVLDDSQYNRMQEIYEQFPEVVEFFAKYPQYMNGWVDEDSIDDWFTFLETLPKAKEFLKVQEQISDFADYDKKVSNGGIHFDDEYLEEINQQLQQATGKEENFIEKYKEIIDLFSSGKIGEIQTIKSILEKEMPYYNYYVSEDTGFIKGIPKTRKEIEELGLSTKETSHIIEELYGKTEQLKTKSNEKIIDASHLFGRPSNQTPVLTDNREGSSTVVSQLEKEFEAREKNVQATDTQSEAELRRQSLFISPESEGALADALQRTQPEVDILLESEKKVLEAPGETPNTSGLDKINQALGNVQEQAEQTAEAEKKLAEAKKESISSQSSNTEETMLPAVIKTTEEVYNQVQAWAKRKQQVEEFIATQKEANNVEESTTVPNESKKFEEITNNAEKAAKAKKGFSEANAEVLRSIVSSLEGLDKEAQAFDTLNKLIKNLANNKDDRILNMVANLKLLRDTLSKPIEDGAFINAIKDIASQGDNLKDLAAILKTSVKDIQKAKKQVNTQEQPVDNTKFYERASETLYNVKLFEKQNQYVQEFSNELVSLQTRLEALKNLDIIDDKNITELDQLIKRFKELKREATLKENKSANTKSVQKFLGQINEILSQNTTRKFKRSNEYQELLNFKNILNGFDTSKPQSELDELGTHILQTISRVKGLDNAVKGKGFFDKFSNRLSDINTKFLAQYFSWHDIIRYGRQMISTIIDLDTQLVDLRKTTKMNNAELESFYKESSSVAKGLGVTTSEIISQASAWSRLGYNTKEASVQMAELSSQFASISPGMDTETATDDLVSTMQAFGIATEEVERKVMDNINAIGNSMATTNAEIGEMLKRSSAAMKAANNSLEQTIALESAAVQITRNAETTGTAFRTISMRIRGYSEESEDGLEEVDEELKNISGDIADLTKINGKGGISIFTDESRNEYKSTYQILKEISEIWNDLTDAQQAGLLEKLAGKRGGQVLAGILADFSSVDEAMETMENAAGSADKEMDIIRDSIEYKLNAIKQQWVGTLTDIAGRDEIKGILDFVLQLSEGLGGIISNLGVLKTAIIGVATVVGSQKLGLFDTGNNKTLIGGIAEIRNNRRTAAMKREGLSQILDIYGDKPDQFLKTEFSELADDFEPVKSILVDIRKQAEETGATGEEALGMVGDAMGDVEIEGSHLGGIFKNIGKSLVNGLASAAISAAITFAIDGLSKWIDTAIMTEAEAQRLSDKFSDAYDSMASDATKTAKEISDVDSEFMQLSKGVNSLGENVSLTDEEFERYHEITSLIADKMPEMVDGYDAQGQAIIRLRDNVNSLTEAYIDNQQEAARELYEKEDDDGSYIEGIYKNAQDKSKSIWSGEHYGVGRWIDIQEQRATYARAASLSYKDAMDALKSNEYIEDILRDAGLNEKTTEEDFYGKIHETLVRDSVKLETDLQDIAKKVQKAGTTFAKIYTGYYDDLTDTQRKYFDATVKHFDFDYLYNNGLLSKDEMEDSMRNLANTFKNLTSEESSKLEMRVNLITQLNSGEITVGKYLAKLKELEQWLNDLPDSDLTRYFTIIFGINEQDESKVTKAKERLMKLMGDNYSEELFNNLSVDDLEKIMNIPIKPAFDERGFEKNIQTLYDKNGFVLNILPEVNQYSVDEIKDILTDGVNPIELETIVNPADSVKSMAELESAVGSLSELYDQVIKKSEDYDPETSGYTFGFANASTLESIKSAFSKYIETLDDDSTKEKLSNVLIAFDRDMIENTGDSAEAIEARQKAMDKLITAYIDQFDWMKNLTEENKEWAKQKLKDMDIANAEEVVESRLNKTNQKLLKGTKKLSDVFRDHATELDKVNEGTKEWYDTIGRLDENGIATEGSILESVRDMFSVEDADGNIINQSVIDNIDVQFIVDNLDLIRQVAEGDAEAINNLRAKLMEPIIATIEINGADETEINSIRDQINDLIRNADIENWTIETDINEKPLIQGLNQLLQIGAITRDQMNAILTGIGVEPYVEKTVPVPIGVSNYDSVRKQLANAYGNSYAAEQAAKAGMNGGGTVDMPVIKYRVSSGGITNAHYSPTKVSTPSTGGGKDSGSKDSEDKLTEDTKETYDWIEVKLKRLEEAYERLDKVSGAVYKSWEKRNNATIDQLANIDEQIEATATAAKHYRDYAFNKVTVEAPKKEDYEDNTKQYEYDQKQYDEYKSRKTEIRDKIINGLIGEKDIEEIGNKYIKEYYDQFSSWYEKYVENNDKLSDLEERRYNKHRELFDNIKTEFDGVLGLFEAEGDAVDKLIERTEEHGYFVSEKYYDKKKVLIQDQIDTETQRLHDLAKARDAAVASGSIKEGSEAWNDMTKEIKDGENEINGLYTELIKLDNEQRQLRWDGFDYAIEKLDKMNEETEFLIDLLDNEDLFNFEYDDRNHKTYDGTMSDRGWAAAGLHASQYNKELLKSKYAAEELAKVEEELATEKGKNDKNLIARREELLGLQRESIQAAEAEKEAIRDLVQEGIYNAPPFSNERWYFI